MKDNYGMDGQSLHCETTPVPFARNVTTGMVWINCIIRKLQKVWMTDILWFLPWKMAVGRFPPPTSIPDFILIAAVDILLQRRQ